MVPVVSSEFRFVSGWDLGYKEAGAYFGQNVNSCNSIRFQRHEKFFEENASSQIAFAQNLIGLSYGDNMLS